LTDSFRQFLPVDSQSKQVTDRCQVSLHYNSAWHWLAWGMPTTPHNYWVCKGYAQWFT